MNNNLRNAVSILVVLLVIASALDPNGTRLFLQQTISNIWTGVQPLVEVGVTLFILYVLFSALFKGIGRK